MAKKVHADDIGQEITHIVQNFIKEENVKCERIMPKVARASRRVLRAESPGEGPYAKGWRTEWENKYMKYYGFQIWNPKHYRLTHLLENGHVIKNQFGGSYGHTRANLHIKHAQDEANRKVIEMLRKEL